MTNQPYTEDSVLKLRTYTDEEIAIFAMHNKDSDLLHVELAKRLYKLSPKRKG